MKPQPTNSESEKFIPVYKKPSDFIGVSPAAQKIRDKLGLFPKDRRGNIVTLIGDTGSGKFVAASILHHNSVYVKDKEMFFHQNCSEFNRETIQSELFGHTNDAYTDCKTERNGCFWEARNGTLVLDEIGDLDLYLQAMLLTAIEQKIVRRFGSDKIRQAAPFIIASTNKNLYQLCCEGKFRWDLYHRLHYFWIYIPPLRHRVEDIPVLAQAFVDKAAEKYGIDDKIVIDKKVINLLAKWYFHGNVRELETIMSKAVFLQSIDTQCGNRLLPHHIEFDPNFVNSDKEPALRKIDPGLSLEQQLLNQCYQYFNEHENKWKGLQGNKIQAMINLPFFNDELKAWALNACGTKVGAGNFLNMNDDIYRGIKSK